MKRLKITEEQAEKLKENLVEPHIDKWIEKSDVSALAHHYSKSDDAGKTGILDRVKAHEKGGEVLANKVSLRARDAKKTLEETDGVIDGISGADDEAIDKLVEDDLNETTTSASSGQYSSKFFIKKGKPNPNLQYPGGSIVTPNPKTHVQGINAILRGKLKEEIENMGNINEQINSVLNELKEGIHLKEYNFPETLEVDEADELDLPVDTQQRENPEPAAPENEELPDFTTNDLNNILDSLKNDVGEDHPVYNHLKEILTHFANPDEPDAPVSPQVIKAFRAALPDSEENIESESSPIATPEEQPQEVTEYFDADDDSAEFEGMDFDGLDDMALDFDDSNVQEPTDDERQAVTNHLKMNSKYGFNEPSMANENDASDIKLFNKVDENTTNLNEEEIANHFHHVLKKKKKLKKGDVKTAAYHFGVGYPFALHIAHGVCNTVAKSADLTPVVSDTPATMSSDGGDMGGGEMDETTGAASSGQYNGKLMGRPNTPEDYMFEDSREESYYDTKYIDANMSDFKDSEGLLANTFGQENVQVYQKSHEGHVVYIRYNGEYEIGLLKNNKFFVKMNDDNYDKYNVFDSLQDIIDAIKSFGSDDDQNTDMMQEEYSKPSPAMANLKKVHNATDEITKSEMKKAGDIVKKGEKTSGVQFVGKVADEVENKSIDNTESQEKFNMISKGMEDLKYANEPSELFTKHFEDGINPVVKSAEVTDQHGNKYPAADHANVVDSDLGENILADIEKKKDLEVPEMDNFVQKVKIVKESDDLVITEEEQNQINEDVLKMKKLLGYKPESYTSTKGNKTDNSLFKTKK